MGQILRDRLGHRIGEIKEDKNGKMIVTDELGHRIGDYDGKSTYNRLGHRIGDGDQTSALLAAHNKKKKSRY